MLGIAGPFPCGHMHLRSVGPSDRHPSVATRRPGGRQSTRAGAIIATITAVAPEVARLGPVRQTYAGTETFPPVARAYTEVSQVVRETGLLARAQWFYALVGAALVLALGGAITGFILLGDTWYQLLIAGALGVIFTQVSFLAHEAAHRQILASGPANDRLGRFLASGIVGISLSWWNNKHNRHHANPNRVGKDPDIEVDTIRFLEEDAAKVSRLGALITRKQGWLFFPLLTLEGLNLHFLGLKHLLSRGEVKGRWIELSLIALRFALYLTPLFLSPADRHGVRLPRRAAGRVRRLHGRLVRTEPQGHADHRGRREARLLLQAGAHLAQHPRRLVGDGAHGRPQLPGRAPPLPEHGPPAPGEDPRDRDGAVPHARRALHRTSLIQSYGIVIAYLNRVGLSARDPFDCPMVNRFRTV